MGNESTKKYVRKYIEETCEVFSEFYTFNNDRFIEGSLVRIYLHSYRRMSTFDKDGNIYVVDFKEIGENFIEKEEWREKQLKKIL